jgi:hypothetical protein
MNALLLACYSFVLVLTAFTIAGTVYEVLLTRDMRKLARYRPEHDCPNPNTCTAVEVLEKVRGEYTKLRRHAALGVVASVIGLVSVAVQFGRLA